MMNELNIAKYFILDHLPSCKLISSTPTLKTDNQKGFH